MGISEVLVIALLGMSIVFVVLLVLMGMIKLISLFVKEKKSSAPATAAPAVVAEAPTAPGSCGEIKLFDVPDKTAAMLMAIVADKLGEPLNTLRFISIKEVE